MKLDEDVIMEFFLEYMTNAVSTIAHRSYPLFHANFIAICSLVHELYEDSLGRLVCMFFDVKIMNVMSYDYSLLYVDLIFFYLEHKIK